MITAMPRIAIAVRDFDAALRTFCDVFGMPIVDLSDTTVPGLGAHVGMCTPVGGSNIELMAPVDPNLPLSRSLLRFLDARGEGLFALMLEAPDPDAEAATLAQRGLEVLPLMTGAGGRDVHPRSTHGVLIRVYPDNSVPNVSARDHGEPGLSGITTVIIAATDACRAGDVYERGFGLDVDPPEADETRGVLRVVCRPPRGGVIEIVSALDRNKAFARDIDRFVGAHEGMYALVLQAADPEAAVAHLGARGIATGGPSLPEATVFGTRFLIEPPPLA